MFSDTSVCGLILAGGRSRRMGGGDKTLRSLGGVSLLERVISLAKPQVDQLVINANGDITRFSQFGITVIKDVIDDFPGPLAGVLTGMEWAHQNRPHCKWIASFACDAPFAPLDLVKKFLCSVSKEKVTMACAVSGGREHPVFGLWPVSLAGNLRSAIVEEKTRKVDFWTARFSVARVEWKTIPVDPFFNVNREKDLKRAEEFLLEMG